MPKINVLSEEVANKIAAGEVVERPASVVKELLENALDAGATKITIEIKGTGRDLIRITDNGEGMDPEDATRCLLRHATSKIHSADDLFGIESLGFRGEALSSIAAVSQFHITTKQEHADEGYYLAAIGGRIERSEAAGANTGTVIEVRELFFNTPARKKFLKSDLVELRHIIDVVTRYALLHYNKSFKLINEGRVIISSPESVSLRSSIASIYGAGIAKELLEVNFNDEKLGMQVTGFISKPLAARNDKSQQSLFLNGRWVKNQTIQEALYDAYHSLLFVNKHPIYVLNVTLDPTQVDVNVHPNKLHVKLERLTEISTAVQTGLREVLKKHNLVPILDLQAEEQLYFANPSHKKKTKPESKYQFEQSEQLVFSRDASAQVTEEQSSDENSGVLEEEKEPAEVQEYSTSVQGNQTVAEQSKGYNATQVTVPTLQREQDSKGTMIEGSTKFPALKILGQIHKTFFVAETKGGMMLIDQHVVQERVLYERFMNQFLNSTIEVQQLLDKELLSFSHLEAKLIEAQQEKLRQFGFTLDSCGENDFWLRTIPSFLGRTQGTELLHSIIAELGKGKVREFERVQEEIITRMACRASVKAGDTLTIPQITALIEELKACVLPYTCPHGRAIMIKITADELEKKFLRHG